MTSKEAYIILGVAPNATQDAIRAAYQARVKATHPDINGGGSNAAAQFHRVQEAYEALRVCSLDKNFDDKPETYEVAEADNQHRNDDGGDYYCGESVTPAAACINETAPDGGFNPQAVRAWIDAEAATLKPGMLLDAIRSITHPHLRAAALLATNMDELCRQGYGGDLAALAVGVNVPVAGNLGKLAFEAFGAAANATTPAKQKAYAKKLKAHTRYVIGFGRLALAQEAFELLRQHRGGDRRQAT